MRVNRLELIDKLNVMMAERTQAAEDRKTQAYDKLGSEETDYVREHAADWSKFADTIRVRNRRGQAITMADVPEGLKKSGWRDCVQVFTPGKVRDADYLPRTEALTRLIAVLQASPDEFISTSALDRIGAPLKELMRP